MSAARPHANPAELAAQSLALYRELRDELRRMLSGIGAAETSWLQAVDDNMSRLRQVIQQADAALMALPPRAEAETGGARLSGLLAERRQIMAEALSLNKEVISQAESVKSLMAHDLAAMRAGRQVLRGYAPPGQADSGSIINRQS